VWFVYEGKPVMPTKMAIDELNSIGLGLYEAVKILEIGFNIRKRKQNIIEKGITKGNKIINVVVVDVGAYYKLIHAGQFTFAKKFKTLKRDENEF
jgi:hypothetical protein